MSTPYRTGKPAEELQTYRQWLVYKAKDLVAGAIVGYWKWALAGVLIYAAIRLLWWMTGPAGCGCHV